MESLDSLNKKLKTSSSVKQVVSTMKTLAAANIKRYEKAANSLFIFKKNIELGLQGILSEIPQLSLLSKYFSSEESAKNVIIAFGSNSGLCGRFNDRVCEFLLNEFKNAKEKLENSDKKHTRDEFYLITVGVRLQMLLENKGFNSDKSINAPSSINYAVSTVSELLETIDIIREESGIKRVFLFYTSYDNSEGNSVLKERLLPLDEEIFKKIKDKQWPTNNIPYWRTDTRELVSDYLELHIFTSIYNALMNSLSSEQKNRLMTLQNAEKNIQDIIESTRKEYNQRRQTVITSELIDVVTGFQVSKKKKALENLNEILELEVCNK